MTRRVLEAMENSGGRRFVVTLGAGLITTVLQWFGKLDPAGSTYALVIVGTVGAYIAGNTVQKVRAPDRYDQVRPDPRYDPRPRPRDDDCAPHRGNSELA